MDSSRLDPKLDQFFDLVENDTAAWCKAMFPSRFSRAFSQAHIPFFQALDDPTKRFIVVKAFRGVGKSTIVQLGYRAKQALLGQHKFIMTIAESHAKAIEKSEDLKEELLTNANVQSIFGKVSGAKWSQDRVELSNGVTIVPKGAGQSVRGHLSKGNRPDLIIVDDLESREGVLNEETRKKTKQWFFSDLMGCVDRSDTNYKIIVIGTILHEDSLLANLCDDTENWHVVDIPLCDQSYNSLYPDYMTTEQIASEKRLWEANGMLSEFHKEYMNSLLVGDSSISRSHFRYFEESPEWTKKNPITENIILFDPAMTDKKENDQSAMVCVGLDMPNSRILVRDVVAGHFNPERVYDELEGMIKRYDVRVLGVKSTGPRQWLMYPLENEIKARNLNVQIVEIVEKGRSKAERVRALVPLYRQGRVWHRVGKCEALEAQLLSYPYSKYWDIMDTLADAAPMLKEGNRFMDGGGSILPDKDEWQAYQELLSTNPYQYDQDTQDYLSPLERRAMLSA